LVNAVRLVRLARARDKLSEVENDPAVNPDVERALPAPAAGG
jgi:hypothetical protein